MAAKEKLYKYTGSGVGVPGLPHQITENQAAAQGLADLLKEAIKAGQYQEVKASKTTAKKRGEQ